MFSPFLRRVAGIKARIPFVNQLRLNFILFHYIYIIAWVIVGSVILYPGSPLAYIDALFFASGASTQSGLNTVDMNVLRLYQQVIIYINALFCTPIFIHTSLVFIRLYWFEKRFQHVVRDARAMRSTRSRMRTMTEDKDGQDENRAEMGVGSRPIVVLRNNTGDARDTSPHNSAKSEEDISPGNATPEQSSDTSSDQGHQTTFDHQLGAVGRDFGLGLNNLRVPTQLSPEHHIAFLESQRKNKGALRIPSPREYDRGGVPEILEEEEEGEQVKRKDTRQSEDQGPRQDDPDNVGPIEGPHITINEPPEVPRTRTRTITFPPLETRPTVREAAEDDGEEPTPLARSGSRRGTLANTFFRTLTQERDRSTAPYLSWNATVGRNSNFVDLTEEQRNELGGIEYRALKTLAVVLVVYYLFFHVLGLICLVPWIMTTHWGKVVKDDGIGRPWWGIFTAASAFNDLGLTLTPNSMESFKMAIFPLILMTYLIVIGNTGFPCMLRFIIWSLSKIVPKGSALWEELKFLLDHPRRCFTLLFPRNATWWLFAILVALNGIDLIFFVVLDLNDPVVANLPAGIWVLDGIFQAACTRTAGFAVVGISKLHPAIQVSYMIMMYISVFPIAISLRRTNVYEEKSLGVYAGTDEEDDDTQTAPSYIGAHLRRQLSFDLWYVFLGLFIIAIVEGDRLAGHDYSFDLFDILFEVVSAYGTVGLSTGYPGVNTSLSGEFKVISKLIIIAMQIRGRHRGLPYSLDRAILLPSEQLHQKESADADRRMRRRNSNLSNQPSMANQPSQAQSRNDAGVSTGRDTPDKNQPTPRMNGDNIIRRQSSRSQT